MALILVDEVHTIGEERGATLEVVLTRMKAISRSPEVRRESRQYVARLYWVPVCQCLLQIAWSNAGTAPVIHESNAPVLCFSAVLYTLVLRCSRLYQWAYRRLGCVSWRCRLPCRTLPTSDRSSAVKCFSSGQNTDQSRFRYGVIFFLARGF